MSARKSSAGMNTDSLSPKIASGVATPNIQASNSMTVVMTTPASAPARRPAPATFQREIGG